MSSSTSFMPTGTNTMMAAATTGLPRYSRTMSTHAISDNDDDVMVSNNAAAAKMAALRENHLQALRAAAANAMIATPAPQVQTPVQTQVLAPPAVMATYAMNPVASAVSPQATIMAAPEPTQAQAPVQQVVTTTTRISRSSGSSSDSSKEVFPMRLHALLADPSVRDVISWLPHGKSFVVLRPDVFATRVLPRYFAPEGSNSLNAKTTTVLGRDGSLQIKNKSQGVHKYPSFTRKLNRWGFRQISRGPDAGAFCHELFQRDAPELCRGLVCQKSRKSKSSKSAVIGGCPDDIMSVSSASTMGTKSVASAGEKRPYSSTVTVSTAGATSNKSLPFKKRKSGQHITNSNNDYMMNGIPSMISHRPQKMPASTSSVTESDVTSDNGSVCSNSNNAVPKASANAVVAAVAAVNNATQVAEAAAKQALARHFHEQHRAFALASLMENSRMAMEAAGIKNQAAAAAAAAASGGASISMAVAGQCSLHQSITNDIVAPQHLKPIPVLGAMTTHSPSVFAPTVYVAEEMKPSVFQAPQAAIVSSAQAAKNALYQAYLQALSTNDRI